MSTVQLGAASSVPEHHVEAHRQPHHDRARPPRPWRGFEVDGIGLREWPGCPSGRTRDPTTMARLDRTNAPAAALRYACESKNTSRRTVSSPYATGPIRSATVAARGGALGRTIPIRKTARMPGQMKFQTRCMYS